MAKAIVEVVTSARLHLGFYNFVSENRVYGSIGVAIKQPELVLKASLQKGINVESPINSEYYGKLVSDVARKLGVKGYSVVFEKILPKHVGLGSTTQTLLAVALAFKKLLKLNIGIRDLASILGRGDVSGIGIAAFERGGFIVDSGRKKPTNGILRKPTTPNDIPAVIFRANIPKSWKFLVITPIRRRGLSEIEEESILSKPPIPPRSLQRELYEILLEKIIPSIVEKDITLFGKALTKLQLIVGKYFSKYQGGIFCCEETETVVNIFSKLGCEGYGQSSWGPTAYCLVKGYRRARNILLKAIEAFDFDFFGYITEVRNSGAKATILYV